ncbi:MAG TPA: protein kinase [Planctomycetota bacterium]|nr:protein kinase [Planctomycetota bacterium]
MNPNESSLLLRDLAVREGMVTAEVVDRILKLAAGRKTDIPLGELLLQFGHISQEQFKRLMSLVREARHGQPGPEDSNLFGEAIVSRGLATPDQVNDSLREQAEMSARGEFKNLGEILVAKGILSPDQVREVLLDQDQIILTCPACSERYNVLKDWRGKAKCPADSTILSDFSEDSSVGIAATLGDANPESPIGLEFGGCRVVEILGKGSMGAVYKAKHIGLNRYVAVKLLPTVSNDPELVKRLLFEARAIAKLEHPNIVQVYDVGFQRGYFFMVMQLLKGQSLEERLRDQPVLPLETALEIARDVARGLQGAHERGVIHRDVKPANIMLTDDGRARLTDFGLAQDVDNAAEPDGVIVGTPFYMSPEQWLGHKADERSDLYSLGVILFTMATGKHPFQGATVSELMNQHLKETPPSPKSIDDTLSDGFSSMVLKLLAKPPKKRYADAAAFLGDLERVMRGEDPEAIQEFGAVTRCGFCEAMNPATEKKCKVCHEPLGGPSGPIEIAVREGEIRCPGCGAINPRRSRHCGGCGKAFCTRCKVRLAVLKGHCHECVSHLKK